MGTCAEAEWLKVLRFAGFFSVRIGRVTRNRRQCLKFGLGRNSDKPKGSNIPRFIKNLMNEVNVMNMCVDVDR